MGEEKLCIFSGEKCEPSLLCGDCEYNTKCWRPKEALKSAYEAGKMLQYQKENGEWVDFSKNTVCDDFKFQKHLNYRIKPTYDHKSSNDKASDYVHIRNYDYTKVQNYIEAIRLIAEKVGIAETDAIEQLARDVGSYLYDLAKGDKND